MPNVHFTRKQDTSVQNSQNMQNCLLSLSLLICDSSNRTREYRNMRNVTCRNKHRLATEYYVCMLCKLGAIPKQLGNI